MNIGDSYNTNVLIMRIDEDRMPAILSAKKEHPRLKRSIAEKGIYLHAEIAECPDNETISFRLSVSVGDIEPDRFEIGYYDFSKDTYKEELQKCLYNDEYANFVCKRMLNNYAKYYLKMPAPFEDAEKTEYVSTDEEKVDIKYISESMCHSIIRKLWKYARNGSGSWDELVKITGLSEDEFYTLMNVY